MLPADSLQEYLKDGKPAEKDDPKESVVDGKYVRPLLDYNIVFTNERGRPDLVGESIAGREEG